MRLVYLGVSHIGQAKIDHNAALNVLAKLDDAEITRATPFLDSVSNLACPFSGATERQ